MPGGRAVYRRKCLGGRVWPHMRTVTVLPQETCSCVPAGFGRQQLLGSHCDCAGGQQRGDAPAGGGPPRHRIACRRGCCRHDGGSGGGRTHPPARPPDPQDGQCLGRCAPHEAAAPLPCCHQVWPRPSPSQSCAASTHCKLNPASRECGWSCAGARRHATAPTSGRLGRPKSCPAFGPPQGSTTTVGNHGRKATELRPACVRGSAAGSGGRLGSSLGCWRPRWRPN